MKNILFTLVLLFLSLTLLWCNSNNNSNQIGNIKTEINTWSIQNETSQEIVEKSKNYIKSSDENTKNFNSDWVISNQFEKIDIINGFSTDGNFLYYLWKKIEWVDPTSFKWISWTNYYKDKNNVYFNNLWWFPLEIIKWVDVKTFELLKKDNIITEFVKHKNNIYYQSNIVNWADAETFIILGCWGNVWWGSPDCYAKDKNSIYFNANKINWISLNTFKIIKNSIYAKDENNIYYKWNIVDWADVNTFKLNDYGIEVDKNYIFSQWKKIEWSDSKTFTSIWGSYYKDSKQIYSSWLWYDLYKVEWADLETFEVIGEDWLAKDKFNRYILWGIDN